MPKQINHSGYLVHVQHSETLPALREQEQEVVNVFGQIRSGQFRFRYAPGKWSICQVLGHIIDVERIMTYRALCFSRGETIELPAFDEDAYVDQAEFEQRSKRHLLAEFKAVRKATLLLYESLSEKQKARKGRFSGNEKSVDEIFRVVAGHTAHHLKILRERYLNNQEGL